MAKNNFLNALLIFAALLAVAGVSTYFLNAQFRIVPFEDFSTSGGFPVARIYGVCDLTCQGELDKAGVDIYSSYPRLFVYNPNNALASCTTQNEGKWDSTFAGAQATTQDCKIDVAGTWTVVFEVLNKDKYGNSLYREVYKFVPKGTTATECTSGEKQYETCPAGNQFLNKQCDSNGKWATITYVQSPCQTTSTQPLPTCEYEQQCINNVINNVKITTTNCEPLFSTLQIQACYVNELPARPVVTVVDVPVVGVSNKTQKVTLNEYICSDGKTIVNNIKDCPREINDVGIYVVIGVLALLVIAAIYFWVRR